MMKYTQPKLIKLDTLDIAAGACAGGTLPLGVNCSGGGAPTKHCHVGVGF